MAGYWGPRGSQRLKFWKADAPFWLPLALCVGDVQTCMQANLQNNKQNQSTRPKTHSHTQREINKPTKKKKKFVNKTINEGGWFGTILIIASIWYCGITIRYNRNIIISRTQAMCGLVFYGLYVLFSGAGGMNGCLGGRAAFPETWAQLGALTSQAPETLGDTVLYSGQAHSPVHHQHI